MPSDPTDAALRDIAHHIALARQFVDGSDAATFSEDLMAVYAVTRCLEIISKASRRLPQALKDRHPAIRWRQIAAAGNVYRHEYEDVASSFVWATVKNDLQPLADVVTAELKIPHPD